MSEVKRKKIAVVGSGISGLTCAYMLHKHHDVKVFEANDYIGGHTATIDITHQGRDYAIDTGFIVFNDRTYPNFIRLLEKIGLKGKPSPMSFSVKCPKTGMEYAGANLNTLFCQRRNLVKPSFLKMVRDILRFNKQAVIDLESGNLESNMTLGDYLKVNKYSDSFIEHYLYPMGTAIWSASTNTMTSFPLVFFIRFFKNHGLLSIKNRPQWYVVPGGSRAYITPLTRGFRENIQLNTSVVSIKRDVDKVEVLTSNATEFFDHVVLATHSDQALDMLADASPEEVKILSALPYQNNEVILHTDESSLPRDKKAWSSWNYRLTDNKQHAAAVTYNMNILQHIESSTTFCVTLNNKESIDPSKIIRTFNYSHPVFSLEGITAQDQLQNINGKQRTWFCGAWARNGFHEDGVVSALTVARKFGLELN